MSGILVHEWLSPRGGSENVFEVLGSMYPDAERWCLWNESDGRFHGVAETWLARSPLRGHKAVALPLMPGVWRSLPARDADWVLCSSHLFAHHARFGGATRHAPKLVYAHTPARYVWAPELDGRGGSATARAVSSVLKPVDRARAAEATAIAANSGFVAERIARVWDREAAVIYPPIEVSRFAADPGEPTPAEARVLAGLPSEFLLGVSRFVPYKRLDLVLRAGQAAGLPIVLAGGGPDEERLRSLAEALSQPVVFVLDPTSRLLSLLYRRALALVFPAVEDFGIMPVEAMAAGTPVVGNAFGGVAESVIDGVTGALVHEWVLSELADAVSRAAGAERAACIQRAYDFDRPVFEGRVSQWVERHVGAAATA